MKLFLEVHIYFRLSGNVFTPDGNNVDYFEV